MFQPVHYTLIFHSIKYVSGGNAQPAFIDAFSIYGRIRPYHHTYNSQRICAAQHWSSASPSVAHTRVYTRVDGVKIYEESSFRPCKNRPKPDRDIKSGSWNHEVVKNRMLNANPVSPKQIQNLDLVLITMLEIYQLYPNEFYQSVTVLLL